MRETILATMVLAAVLCGMNASATGICGTDGTTLTCDNPESGGYATWKVGKDTGASRIYACALVGGVWTRVGYETYTSETTLSIKGNLNTETITVIDSASETCDAAGSLTAGQIPSGWFSRIIVHGYRGNDTINGSYRGEDLYGDSGMDDIDGRSGDDSISGGSEDDYILGGPGVDEIDGDDGADEIYGEGGGDTITGGAGNDYVEGNDGADTIDGGADTDHLYGNGGNDTITGGSGRDWMYGGSGLDIIDGTGDAAIDMIYGEDDIDDLDEDNGYCDGGAPTSAPGDVCDCASESSCES